MTEVPKTSGRKLNAIEQFFADADRQQRRDYMRQYNREQMKYPHRMTRQVLPEDVQGSVLGEWRSNKFHCLSWPSSNPLVLCRLSINKCEIDPHTGSFLGGISWDDLYTIKSECGFGDYDAVEVYPAEANLENVSNIRHLWIMAHPLTFGLTKG